MNISLKIVERFKNSSKFELTEMHPSYYYDFGLAKGLTNVLSDARRPFSQTFFGLVTKIDGLPLIKPSGSQNCQILAQIPDGLDECDSAPFLRW